LGEGHSRIRTGDGEFRADSGQLVALISVAKFGGSDSLPIRPSERRGSAEQARSQELLPVAIDAAIWWRRRRSGRLRPAPDRVIRGRSDRQHVYALSLA